MELESLSMAPGEPDIHHVAPRASAPEDLAEKVARGVATAATKILENLTRAPPVDEKSRPPVDKNADATIRECFLRWRAATPSSGQAASGWVSTFERLGQQALVSQEDQWVPQPEMTPRKIEWGRQPNKEPEPQWAGSQKRRSQSCPRDEADPKKGRTEGEGKPTKIQVGIDWTTTGIQKPIAKADSRQPSSKTDTSAANRQQSRQKESQKQGSRWSGKEARSAQAAPGNPEKIELRDKPYRWIESRLRCLDASGFLEEIHSLRFFKENSKDFALQIIAIADWGRKYLEVGLSYPVPTFPDFLFTPVPDSHQGGSQVPVRPLQVRAPGGDVRDKSREAWKWMVTLLQFWTDEASSANGLVYGGRERPVSALVEYVFNTINLGLEPGFKVMWDDVVVRTPWMAKHLHGMMGSQEMTVRRQPLPQPGVSSQLEITLERLYTAASTKLKSSEKGKAGEHGAKPKTTPRGLPNLGHGTVPKVRLRKDSPGLGWSHVTPKDTGPDVGHPYQTQKEEQAPEQEAARPDRSPLTSELLGPGEEVIGDLDYKDVVEADQGPDPEIVEAVANIPDVPTNWADVEMQESRSPPGFEPEVARDGYDVNLVRPNPTEPTATSPVMAAEIRILDAKTPGAGRPDTEDPGRTDQ